MVAFFSSGEDKLIFELKQANQQAGCRIYLIFTGQLRFICL